MMRFRLRKLFLAIATVAVICGLYVAARSSYFSERRQAEAVLAEVSGISDVQLHPYVDRVEEVNSMQFTVDGQPDSIVQLGGLVFYQDDGRFSVGRIGKWQFRTSGRRYGGAFDAVSGEPVESDYRGFHIELGPRSPYKDLIPFEVNAIQDLVDHYEDLVVLFESWPREAEPGTVKLEDGSMQYFYVVPESE